MSNKRKQLLEQIDDKTLIAEYRKFVVSRLSPISTDNPEHTAILGIAGESGELADYFKKVLFQGHDTEENKVLEEIGDLLFYIVLLLHSENKTLVDAIIYNVNKLLKRYPTGFSSERSKNRGLKL